MTPRDRSTMYGDALRAERKRRRMTQDELAREIGVSTSALSRYESGDVELPERLRPVAAAVFRLPAEELFPHVPLTLRAGQGPLARAV